MTELEAKAKDCIENHTHKLVDKPTKQDIYLREESIFISGYKLGATENGIQWHGLRKDPNDLPKDRHNVWITYVNAYYQTVTTEASFRHKFWVINGHKTECEVIAWCEIPQFKE